MDLGELLKRGVKEVIVQEKLIEKLKSKGKLRVKHGVDPTTKNLHLGHAAVYHKLREFQELGHKIVFLIGDFTARFGDPSDKLKCRQLKHKKEVINDAKNYLEQVGKILDLDKMEIRYNGEWYDKMKLEDFLRIKTYFTHARLVERDMFQQRIKKNLDIGAHELDYPILQAYDSVMLKSDLTVCGNDQKFNELCGRHLQVCLGQVPQDIMTVPILVGLDGHEKMSQSLKNDIKLSDQPDEMYGKVMSLPDEVVVDYFELAARTAGRELAEIKNQFENTDNRRDLKAKLAREIVSLYHGSEESLLAEENFVRTFRERKIPLNIPEIKLASPKCENLPSLLFDLKLVASKNEARRLIEQGGVKIDQAALRDIHAQVCFHDKMIIQVGKLKWVRIRL